MDALTQKEKNAYNRRHGIAREERVPRQDNPPNPKRGGARGYPPWFRDKMLHLHSIGVAIPKEQRRSVRRWKNQRKEPYEMTGNKATRGMDGHHRFLLAIFKKIYPQASRGECAVYIACHSNDNAVFTDSEISSAVKDMDMTRKKASTTAYQAFTPDNVKLHHRFWTYPAPNHPFQR